MKALLAALLLACAAAAGGAEALGKRPTTLFPDLPATRLQLMTASGTHTFSVWIAADYPSRERGLMYVRELPADQGMLFLFEEPHVISFWMLNTYLPLDIIFIAGDGRVVNIARGTPHSQKPIRSTAPAVAVIELIAGSASRIGLAPGDRASWSVSAAGKRDDEFVQ